jgi:hypothetical protein
VRLEDLANRRYPFLLEDQSNQLDLEDLVDLLGQAGLVGQLVQVGLVDRQYPINLIVLILHCYPNLINFFFMITCSPRGPVKPLIPGSPLNPGRPGIPG